MGTIILWTCLGIFLGWVVIPQPAWAATVLDKIKAWITEVQLWFSNR